MRFSIIVPVYNVEPYIGRCMDSLVNQSFRDYELIIVDDESPDRSMDIVKSYAEKDPERIHILTQKNTRQGGARNNGVRHAQGDYILFVDSDDYVSPQMLETVDRRLKQQPCDILVFAFRSVSEQGTPLSTGDTVIPKPGLYHPQKDREAVLLPCGPVNKAFRREFYMSSGVEFPEKLLYEDGITRLLYAKANSILVTDDPLYFYVRRENSSMTQKLSEKMLDILPVTDLVCRSFRDAGLYEDFREPLEISLIYGILYILDRINLQDPKNEMQKPMAEFIRTHFPDYGKNPFASPALVRLLDLLLASDFQGYHRRLKRNAAKDRLLQIGFIRKLNDLRKKR